jgi:uncharacterized protein YecT (DUF1311 family)
MAVQPAVSLLRWGKLRLAAWFEFVHLPISAKAIRFVATSALVMALPDSGRAANIPCLGLVGPAAQQCTSEAMDQAEKEVTAAYNLALAKMDADHRRLLAKSQATWQDYVQAECDFEADGSRNGGNAWQEIYACSLMEYRRRARQIRDQIDWSSP